ncbi:MAG: hypothetical protein ACTSU4_13450 [Promethearchaeota archaeon]
MTLYKRYQLKWVFEAPDVIRACSVLKCPIPPGSYILFGGHDKTLYMMDLKLNIVNEVSFDGWVRCIHSIDLDGDGNHEAVLIGSGDGTMMVLKFDPEKETLRAIMRYKAEGMITCCTAGDLTSNGSPELLFGCSDKTLRIFQEPFTNEPTFTLYYDSWVTQCSIGSLKLPEFKDPIQALLIGTKKGMLQLIILEAKKDRYMPNILWQRYMGTQINVISIGDVNNDGLNEIVVSTNDSFIKILNSAGENIKYMRVDNGKSISLSRPLAIKIDDIDGDKAKELIVGCADGTLRVYHNPDLNSNKLKLKWKTKVSTSIKDICTIDDPEKKIKTLIFGGYDRTLRNIMDFEWGKKPVLEVPQKIPRKKISAIKKPFKMPPQPIPTNIMEQIFLLLQGKKFYWNKELLSRELIAIGYKPEVVERELNRLIENHYLLEESLNVSVLKSSELLIKEMEKNKQLHQKNDSQELTKREKLIQAEMNEDIQEERGTIHERNQK